MISNESNLFVYASETQSYIKRNNQQSKAFIISDKYVLLVIMKFYNRKKIKAHYWNCTIQVEKKKKT